MLNNIKQKLNNLKSHLVAAEVRILEPKFKTNMIGAGVSHKGKDYVTHTTLHHKKSALKTFVLWQKIALSVLVFGFVVGLTLNWLLALQIAIGVLTVIYFIDVVFNLYLVVKSLHLPPELDFTAEEIAKLKNKDLPVYTILCPMYREA